MVYVTEADRKRLSNICKIKKNYALCVNQVTNNSSQAQIVPPTCQPLVVAEWHQSPASAHGPVNHKSPHTMKYSDQTLFKNEPTQDRSKKAMEEILESAKALSDEGLLELLNARNLSTKSGYSVGTIYRYFEKFEHIFLRLFLWRRTKAIAKLAEVINGHDPHCTLSELVTQVVDFGMAEWSSKNPKILKMVVRLFFRHADEPEQFNTLADELIPALLVVQGRDQTNTFRFMTTNELRLQVRAFQMVVRNPFVEGDPFAGTPEHRRCSIEMGIRLLGN